MADSSAIQISVKGLEDLAQVLKSFPEKVSRNILSKAVYAGAIVVRDAARANAPVKTGKLRKSIKIRSARSKRGSMEKIFRVYAAAYYGHMVERGTKAHKIKHINVKALKIGKAFAIEVDHPGIQSPRPFLRPALDENTINIIEAMRVKLKAGIELYVKGPKLGHS